MRKTLFILCVAPLFTGCITTDSQGRPIAREVQSQTRQSKMEAALAEATLDGSRIVASGKPPIAFLYPGTGRLSVRNLDDRSIVFTVELPDAPDLRTKTLISISADGKLTGNVSRPDGTSGVTEIATVSKSHTFAITYLPAIVPAAPRRSE